MRVSFACRQSVEPRRLCPPPFAGGEPPYEIRHDADATAKILRLLMEAWRDRPGEYVRLEAELGTKDVWAIRWYVDALRRIGHRITSRRPFPGYRYEGCDPPPKWLHLENVLRDVVLDSLDREDAPQQLRLPVP